MDVVAELVVAAVVAVEDAVGLGEQPTRVRATSRQALIPAL
jgi:hypothetical protein